MLDLSPMQMVARQGLQTPALMQSVPAAFAETPDTTRTGRRYQFISTARIVEALLEAGFTPTRAQQAGSRRGSAPIHARHMIRFSLIKNTLSLLDAIPELILVNSHDGSGAYTLRAGLYRPLCTNGLVTPIGDFGLIHVAHRGNIVHNVVDAALEIARGFEPLGRVALRMATTMLAEAQRWDFAARALAIRYPNPAQHKPVTPDQLLLPRREADFGRSVWHTFNTVQENCVTGGLQGRSASGRLSRTRAVRAIRDDVRINVALWNHAVSLLDA